MNKDKVLQVVVSYLRASAAAALALYLAGEHDAKALAAAALAAVAGPLLKWLDPSAPEFGRTKK